MEKVFISYRRDDSGDITGRIYDWLVARIGSEKIFRDVDNIPIGIDFKKYLENVVGECSTTLVVIGPNWLTFTDSSGNRRIDDPRDFVRIEVETALRRDIPVIPILVGGATMPNENELPSSLVGLSYRNGLQIRRDPDFRNDMERLIKALETILGQATELQEISKVAEPPFELPYLEWCDIPAGNIMYSGKLMRVEAFRIAKYPVTYAQFQAFIEASDGYTNEKWWNHSPFAMDYHRQNPYPAENTFKGELRPRENVSWYEALAFCRWLYHKTQLPISLPSEYEWLRAAQGNMMNDYPWGSNFDASKCNTRESEKGHTTPVNRYAEGVSPFGVFDMLGNIWEWTRTERDSGSGSVLSGNLRREICGGSWRDSQNTLRAARRSSDPRTQRDNIGFRLAILVDNP